MARLAVAADSPFVRINVIQFLALRRLSVTRFDNPPIDDGLVLELHIAASHFIDKGDKFLAFRQSFLADLPLALHELEELLKAASGFIGGLKPRIIVLRGWGF